MHLDHLSTNTPASEVSSASFDDGSKSNELNVPSLDDILRNSPAAKLLGLPESLPEEEDGVPAPDDTSDNANPDNDESSANEEGEEQVGSTEDDNAAEDDTSTQNAELPSEEDIDWDYKVPITIDGKTEYKTLEEIRKGYSTDQHLSQKGRELGELKKQVEQERTNKLQELITLGESLHTELSATEATLSTEYHKLTAEIEKAKEDGDSYQARELKDKREDIQEKYWKARKGREEKIKAVSDQLQAQQQQNQQALLESFKGGIKDAIPDYSDKVASAIREFAIKEGISEELLSVVYDVNVVKFINDYRKLKTAKDTGEAKRKAAPTVKSVPTKKGTPISVKQTQAEQSARQKVLSGQGSKSDELDFLKRISSVSKKL